MIAGFLNTLKTCTDFFISFGIIVGFVAIFSSVVLKRVQKTNRKRVVALFIISLCVDIILSTFAFFVYVLFTKYSYENLNLYLLFTLIFSVNLNLSLAINIRRGVSRARKSMSFGESIEESINENSRKTLDVLIYYLLFLLAILFLANKETGSFIGTLFLPVFVCSCISAFASHLICKLSERVFK